MSIYLFMRKIVAIIFVVIFLITENIFAQNQSYEMSRALEAFEKEEYQEAVSFLEKEIAQNPNNAEAYGLEAKIYRINDFYSSAAKYAKSGIAICKKSDRKNYISLRIELVQIYEVIDRYDLMLPLLNEAVDVDDTYGSLEWRGWYYLLTKEYDKAEADLRAALKKTENSAEVVEVSRFLTDALIYQGKASEAVKIAHDAAQAPEASVEQFVDLAQASIAFDKPDKAAVALVEAFARVNNKSEYNYISSYLESDTNLLKYAEPICQYVIEAATKDEYANIKSSLYALISDYSGKIGNYVRALDYAWRFVDTGVGNYGNIARVFQKHFNIDEAFKYYEMYVNSPESENYSLAHYAIDKLVSSYYTNDSNIIDIADEAIDLNPDVANVYIARGLLLALRFGRYTEALADINLAIQLEYDNVESYFARAWIHQKLGNTEEAKADAQKIIDIETENKVIYRTPFAQMLLGNSEEAKKQIENVEANTESETYGLAWMYAYMGDKENCLRYIQKTFDKHWYNFAIYECWPEFDLVRNTPEYKKMMQEAQKQYDEETITMKKMHNN